MSFSLQSDFLQELMKYIIKSNATFPSPSTVFDPDELPKIWVQRLVYRVVNQSSSSSSLTYQKNGNLLPRRQEGESDSTRRFDESLFPVGIKFENVLENALVDAECFGFDGVGGIGRLALFHLPHIAGHVFQAGVELASQISPQFNVVQISTFIANVFSLF